MIFFKEKKIDYCKDMIWIPSPKNGWTQAKKTQNNELIESGLENWAKMNWTTKELDSIDKKRQLQ